MYGKHPVAWNKGMKGEMAHNWKGGTHTRKDGYVRINIEGKRHLLHRYIMGKIVPDGSVVHHLDGNPSNNSPDNLVLLSSQSEHASLHAKQRRE